MKKFKVAFTGLILGIKDKSILIQYILGVLVLAFSLIIKLDIISLCLIIILVSLVIGFEYLNTCIEKLCDLITKEENFKIKYIKDLAAGAVLIQAICSAIIFILLLKRLL